jgi:hypothetical protein
LIGKLFGDGIDVLSDRRGAVEIVPLNLDCLEEILFGGEDVPFEVDIP